MIFVLIVSFKSLKYSFKHAANRIMYFEGIEAGVMCLRRPSNNINQVTRNAVHHSLFTTLLLGSNFQKISVKQPWSIKIKIDRIDFIEK